MDGTDVVVEDFLAHFGVKGMRWGVRKDPARAAENARRSIAKLDKKFEKVANKADTHMRLWTHSVVTLKKSGDLKKINDKPEYQAAKWRLRAGIANRQLQKKYEDEVAAKLMEHLKKNANEIVNRSATRQLDIQVAERVDIQRTSKNKWRIVTREIQHAAGVSLEITLVRDEVGRIIDLIPESGTMQQSDVVDDFLMHFGVKGMKWGVRKKKPHPVSADARQKQNIKDKVKQTKIASVSNTDLQAAIRRMQLEQDFKRLKVNEQNGVTRWLSSTLLEIGKREVQAQAGKQIGKFVAKAALTGGAG